MSVGGIELHGSAGLAIAFVVALTLIATFLLTGAALRRAPGGWMARSATAGFAAMCICNAAGHMWVPLRPVLWACIPLQAFATVTALIALVRTRHDAFAVSPAHVGHVDAVD